MNKQVVLVSLLIGIVLVGLVGCVGKGKQAEKKEKVPASVEATTLSTKEMKTYVSKAGFSVTYPAKWYLDENRGAGWRIGPEGPAFTIANKDPYYYIPRGGDNVEVFFNAFDDLPNSPSDINKKLEYYVKEFGMRSIDESKIIKIENEIFCLSFGIPRGRSDKYNVLFFYLPKSKTVASAIIYSSGLYSIKKLTEIISIKTIR
ncbi:MAG: PsbP-related protein [Candidatus Margulisiibacteriota bacterium]